MKCLILAGGFGTRMYPLTIWKAKALLEYRGKPLVTHIVEKVPEGLDILVSCNARFAEDFREWQKGLTRKVEIGVEEGVWKEEQKKGAVGSLLYWVQKWQVKEDLLLLAGDNYFEFRLADFIAAYDGKHPLVAIRDVGERSKARDFGVVSLSGSRITEFEEKPREPKSSLVAIACYLFPPTTLALLTDYCSGGGRDNLGSFVAHLIGRMEVRAFVFNEFWIDIGSIESLSK